MSGPVELDKDSQTVDPTLVDLSRPFTYDGAPAQWVKKLARKVETHLITSTIDGEEMAVMVFRRDLKLKQVDSVGEPDFLEPEFSPQVESDAVELFSAAMASVTSGSQSNQAQRELRTVIDQVLRRKLDHLSLYNLINGMTIQENGRSLVVVDVRSDPTSKEGVLLVAAPVATPEGYSNPRSHPLSDAW